MTALRPFLPLVACIFLCFPAIALAGDEVFEVGGSVESKIRLQLRNVAPEAVPAWRKASEDYYAERLKEARAGFEEVLKKAPTFGPAYRRLAVITLHEGNKAGALVHARKALELDPSSNSQLALADVLLADPAPDPSAAERAVDAAVSLAPDDVAPFLMKGQMSARREDRASLTLALVTLRRLAPTAVGTRQLESYEALLSDWPDWHSRVLIAARAAEDAGAHGFFAEMVEKIASRETRSKRKRLVTYGTAGFSAVLLVAFAVFRRRGRRSAESRV